MPLQHKYRRPQRHDLVDVEGSKLGRLRPSEGHLQRLDHLARLVKTQGKSVEGVLHLPRRAVSPYAVAVTGLPFFRYLADCFRNHRDDLREPCAFVGIMVAQDQGMNQFANAAQMAPRVRGVFVKKLLDLVRLALKIDQRSGIGWARHDVGLASSLAFLERYADAPRTPNHARRPTSLTNL